MKKILTKSITTIMYLLLITLLSASCTKENTIAPKQQSKITIRVEDYGGADVKSSTQTSPICTDAFRLNDKYFATMQLIEDQGQATNQALTKADNYNYTILVFDSGNKLVQKVEGTVTNGEGDFTIDYNKTTGKITKTGTYKFVCVANGTLSATLGSTATSITFRWKQDISKPALISDVLTKTITDAQVNSNTVPDLDFLMRHKESGLRVKIVSEAEAIPSGLKVNLNLPSAEPNTAKYSLPTGVNNSPTTANKVFSSMAFPNVSTAGQQEFTTGYLYFLEKTGLKKDLKLTYTDATNKTLGGVLLNKLTTDLFNLPELKANRRYTVVVTFTPVANNNLTRAEVEDLLPAWRFADRNVNHAGTGLATDDRVASSGLFTYEQAIATTLILGGKAYNCPSIWEYNGILPEICLNNGIYFNSLIEKYTILEYVSYGDIEKKKSKATYWGLERTDNNIVKYDYYGIKLYTNTDYSHACAYRYRFVDIGSENECMEITTIYLGNDAKYYLNIENATELKLLFDTMNSSDRPKKILKFPSDDIDNVATGRKYWSSTGSLTGVIYAYMARVAYMTFGTMTHNYPIDDKVMVRLCR